MVVATAQMAPDLEHLDAQGVLDYAVERFHPRLVVACSFQKEASVVLDLILRAAPDARVFTLDTHVLFPETYATWKAVEERYGIEVEVFQGPSLGRQAAEHGDRLWERDPDACCDLRKVQPLNARARRRGRLGRRPAPRPVAVTRRHAQARLGRQARALEVQPARGLDRPRRVALHRRARPALQPAPRPGLPDDRVHALHRARAPGAKAAGPARGKTECGLHA